MPDQETEIDKFTRRLELRIDRARWQRLQELCARFDVPVSEALRRAIDELYDNAEGELL